jgi:hypothetical protein
MKAWHMVVLKLERTFTVFWLALWFFFFFVLGIWHILWRCTHGLSSISLQFSCVAFMWSMASTIALLLPIATSITSEKTLFYFHFISILPNVIRVVGSFSFACCWIWMFDKLTNNILQWWVFSEKLSKFTTFTWIITVSLPSFTICSSAT